MTEFNKNIQLKIPLELTSSRHINPDNQICKDGACNLAKKHNVIWMDE